MGRYYDGNDTMRRKALGPVSQADLESIDLVKTFGQQLFNVIDSLGASRELSLAKTKVEEAIMWAVKGLTA